MTRIDQTVSPTRARPVGRKVIITCAVTGSIHTPTMSPHLPITPDEIATSAIAAAKAGASILHLHARDPLDGRPTPDPEVFRAFLPQIHDATDAVINITTGGGHNMTVQDRLAAPLAFRPEMCSLNMGSMNFGLFPLKDRYPTWKHNWEPDYLENSRDFIFRNTFKDIEYILKHLGEDCGTRFEFECYDVGHLYTLAHFLDRGLVKAPLFIQTIFGILGGIGADPQHLMHMRETADRLFGDAYQWSILAAGRHQMGLCTMGAIMGGNVRVGLEDSLYLGKGQLAESNAAQVARIRTILSELSLEVATPAETRALLDLKGAADTALNG
ncbi:3-keto-5-aminohexanoate cleavage protein [Tabrizicola sp. TH137]|uniref:3-keto-5-aminohexanoate cleavage protein n=1 Tax=Tabrizicola sp. TH137 TaxID=2067452 RepID=UPI000C7A16F2|nr:3-keto-5-aminohexanoate cleavage protein [Tabrizicola sp. TH137]PLL12904.1 3-keto-5-aminohexanoate cleavage protein [Tabrizicola sp. TH137]